MPRVHWLNRNELIDQRKLISKAPLFWGLSIYIIYLFKGKTFQIYLLHR